MITFSPILLLWYIFPLIVLLVAQIIVKLLSLTKRFQLKAPDLAVPFLIYGIHELSVTTFTTSIFPYYLLSILSLGIGLALFHAYFYAEIKYGRFFKMYWRSVYLLSLLLHTILIIVNIISMV